MASRQPLASDPVKKLQTLIQDIRVAMLVTHVGPSGLHGRPMQTQAHPFDGTLYFLTPASSPKALEIEEDEQVALVYADAQTRRYVYVTGSARLTRDAAIIDELWSPEQEAWFPDGKDDPDLRVLAVTVERALYWIQADPAQVDVELDKARAEHRRPDYEALGETGTVAFSSEPVPGAEGVAAGHGRRAGASSDDHAHNTGRVGAPGARH